MEVYLMQMGKHYKVGRSKCSERRLKQLGSVKFPTNEPIRLVHKVETPYAKQLEWRLHQMFNHSRVNGEWFELTDTQVRELKDLMNKGFEPVQIRSESKDGTVSIAEAARYLGLSRQAVYNAVRDGRIPAVAVQVKTVMITRESLDKWEPNPNMKRTGRPARANGHKGSRPRGSESK
jgi:excisionase family DNA binding protein